jgi:hypothetical protein
MVLDPPPMFTVHGSHSYYATTAAANNESAAMIARMRRASM